MCRTAPAESMELDQGRRIDRFDIQSAQAVHDDPRHRREVEPDVGTVQPGVVGFIEEAIHMGVDDVDAAGSVAGGGDGGSGQRRVRAHERNGAGEGGAGFRRHLIRLWWSFRLAPLVSALVSALGEALVLALMGASGRVSGRASVRARGCRGAVRHRWRRAWWLW